MKRKIKEKDKLHGLNCPGRPISFIASTLALAQVRRAPLSLSHGAHRRVPSRARGLRLRTAMWDLWGQLRLISKVPLVRKSCAMNSPRSPGTRCCPPSHISHHRVPGTQVTREPAEQKPEGEQRASPAQFKPHRCQDHGRASS